jgi:L-fuculose-phosphate aldolase
MKSLDLSNLKVIAVRDIEAAGRNGATELVLQEKAILTPSARDVLRKYNMTVRQNGAGSNGVPASNGVQIAVSTYGGSNGSIAHATSAANERLFHSPEAEAIKAEIVNVGRKLWMRQYVDGNGGNISYRIGENAVICTPTLISKADLRPEDLCMVDLEGNQLAGQRPRTSEILLHLEIYKAVPQAKGVVHCHPPHATAYAITGRVPPSAIIPEFDVFIGSVALSPYETPGTQKFAETVIPYVKSHNTILLGNHGIVTWADTVTHAEWYAEVLETYCWTLLISNQLGVPFTKIPPAKEQDLLEIKKRLGLPDARFDMKECQLSDLPDEMSGKIALPPPKGCGIRPSPETVDANDVDAIVQAVTDAVMSAMARK